MKNFIILILACLLTGCMTDCKDPNHKQTVTVNSPHVYTVMERTFFTPRYSPTIYRYTLIDEKGVTLKVESFADYKFGDKLTFEITVK